MTYCYTPMDFPAFHAFDGSCEGEFGGLEVKHDFVVENGGLKPNDILTINAILIQLGTDLRANNQRGWWGNQFEGFEIGSRMWTITGQQNVSGVTVLADEMIREALGPLIDQGLFDEIRVRSVRVVGGVESEIDILKNGQSLMRTVI